MAYVTPPVVQARKRQVKSLLIDCAAELFARQGYEATTMQQIVKQAGTSIGNCYFYFKDKEALISETTRRLCRRVDLRISQVAQLFKDPHSRMAAALWVGSQLMIRYRDMARILFMEAPKTGARAEVLKFLRRRVEISFANRANQTAELHLRSPASILLRDPSFITIVWTGAVWAAFEAVARDELTVGPEELGRRLVWWNLGALGLPPTQIDGIIKRLRETIAPEPSTTPGDLKSL